MPINQSLFKIKFAEAVFMFENRPLRLYNYQKTFLSDSSRYRIVRKARQLGLSLTLAIEALIECFLNPNYTVLFVSTGEDAAKRILDYVYDLIHGMPSKIRPTLTVQTKTEIRFANKSKLVSLPNNPSTVRGYRAHRVYIDEAAHFINDQDIFSAIQPSISRGGKMTVVSTPFGKANKFYEIWDSHELYSRHTIHWTECPDIRYIDSVKQDKKDMDEVQFNQEYCCDFASDDMAYFPFQLLRPCIDENLFNMSELHSRNFCRMGYDPGGRIDAGCITITEEVPIENDRLFILRNQTEYKKVPIPKQIEEIENFYKSFNLGKIYLDETSMGIPISEELITKYGEVVEPIRFSSESKEGLISTLRILFERKAIRIPNDDKLLYQLMNIERSTTPTGKVKYKHAGKSQHDDRVWSLCLSVAGVMGEVGDIGYILGNEMEMKKIQDKFVSVFDTRQGEGKYGFV